MGPRERSGSRHGGVFLSSGINPFSLYFLRTSNQKKRPSDSREAYFWSSSSSRATELMQYLSPVGCGPSSKTCPRWASHRLHFTSVRRIPWLVSLSASTAPSLAGALQLGPPGPDWHFVCARTRGWP